MDEQQQGATKKGKEGNKERKRKKNERKGKQRI
jgi:hypothetical protein